MGTLGKYLRDARESRGIDLRDAAQQTRISIQYLKALEAEDFSKLPGAVFVRGFLKNYSKFLRLDESEVMARFGELQQTPSPGASARPSQATPQHAAAEEPGPSTSEKIPVEPFIWAAVIIVVLVIALFAALPRRHRKEVQHPAESSLPAGLQAPAPSGNQLKPEKLYLEVIALENTWLLVRIDTSPQKKEILAKGDSLIWSADERFLVSYGSAGALRLLLNGKELNVDEPKNAVVRDMTITSAGILNRKIQSENVRPPRRKQQVVSTETLSRPSPTAGEQVRVQHPKPAAAPVIPLPNALQEGQTSSPETKPAQPDSLLAPLQQPQTQQEQR